MNRRDEYFRVGILHLRKQAGLSQVVLAERTGIQRVSISQIETATRGASLDTQWALAEAFDLTPEGVMEIGRGLVEGTADEAVEAAPAVVPAKPVAIDLATEILNEALEETGIDITARQKEAVAKVIREELEKTRSRTKSNIVDMLKAFAVEK